MHVLTHECVYTYMCRKFMTIHTGRTPIQESHKELLSCKITNKFHIMIQDYMYNTAKDRYDTTELTYESRRFSTVPFSVIEDQLLSIHQLYLPRPYRQ